MATPVKAFTYLETLETLAPPLKPPGRLDLQAMVERVMRPAPPLWHPLAMLTPETLAPPLKMPVRLDLQAMVERVMTIFWRGERRTGWQVFPRGQR